MHYERIYYPGKENVYLDCKDVSTSYIMEAIKELGIEMPKMEGGDKALDNA